MAAEPALARDQLRGAVLFYDCQMDDARLCLETILDACRLGARCANYCQVIGFRQTWDRVDALQVVDRIGGQSFDVRAKCYVNATGPWVEQHHLVAQVRLLPLRRAHVQVGTAR